jgi:translation initiation factor 1 (eIF-1/SUI1)
MSAHDISIVTSQISSIDAEIEKMNAEVSNIDGATITGAELQALAAARKSSCQTNCTALEAFKTKLEAKLAVLQGGWSAPRQTIVDGISTDFSGAYDENLNNLLKDTTEKQDEFFTVYAQADTEFLKELAIQQFFNL